MRTANLNLLFLLAVPAFSDTITVTLLDQTGQVSAFASNYLGQTCSSGGVSNRSASCNLPGTGAPNYLGEVQSAASVGPLPNGPPASGIYASAGAGCCAAGGNAAATITDTVLISGGQGTGYLNVDFLFSQYGYSQQSSGSWGVNTAQGAQSFGLSYLFPQQVWGIATFQFGQPFTFSYAVSAGGDSSDPGGADISMWLFGARIYTSQPTQCGIGTASVTNIYWGLCSDPNFTSGEVLGNIYGVNAVPEPSSLWLTLAGVLLLPVIRRARKDAR